MDLTIAGRLRTVMPGLVAGLRKASETPAGPRVLLDRAAHAAPTPEALAKVRTGGMAAAGSLRPPPPPSVPTDLRSVPERTERLAEAARALATDPRVAENPGRSGSVERLGRALDLLDATVREQRDLLRRGLRDLR
jgi:hypothetical protein